MEPPNRIRPPSQRGRGRGGFGRGTPSSPAGLTDLRSFLYGTPSNYEGESSTRQETAPSLAEVVAKESSSFCKTQKQNIIEINPQDYHINNPWALFERYLGNNPFPFESNLTRENYEKILIQLKCVEISHTRDSTTGTIIYSKCVILKFILPSEWELTPFQEKSIFLTANLQVKLNVNYWCYVQAMMKAFFLLNETRKHSWMFIVKREVLAKEIPAWFYRWWNYFGAELDILPAPIKDVFSKWMEINPVMRSIHPRKMVQGKNLVYYFTDCSIPWIWSWNVVLAKDPLNQLVLQRSFHLRWWNQINVEEKLKQIQAVISSHSASPAFSHQPIKMDFEVSVEEIFESIRRLYPHENDEQHKARLTKLYEEQLAKVFKCPMHICSSGESEDGFDDNTSTADLADP